MDHLSVCSRLSRLDPPAAPVANPRARLRDRVFDTIPFRSVPFRFYPILFIRAVCSLLEI